MYGVIDVGNCVFCRNVYTNVIFLQNGRICCERPIMYLRQIPENAWNYGNNNYIYANRVNMQKIILIIGAVMLLPQIRSSAGRN